MLLNKGYPFPTMAYRPLPLGRMSLKAFSKDLQAAAETDLNRKVKLENQARMIRLTQNKAAK